MGKLGVVSLAFVLAAVCVPQVAAFSHGGPRAHQRGTFSGRNQLHALPCWRDQFGGREPCRLRSAASLLLAIRPQQILPTRPAKRSR